MLIPEDVTLVYIYFTRKINSNTIVNCVSVLPEKEFYDITLKAILSRNIAVYA